MNNTKLMISTKRKIVMIDEIYEETDRSDRSICKGIMMQETSKGWYTAAGKKMRFAFQGVDLEVGAIYSLEAHLVSDTTHDALYQVDHAELLACASYAAMTFFLLRSEHATPKRVRLLLEKYGMNVLDEIANDYYMLDFLGLSPDVQSGLYIFAAKRILFGIVLRILEKYKLDCRLAAAIYDTYKNDLLEKVVSMILDNPYQLFLDNTLTFNQADALYLRMGNPVDSETRCRHAILAALKAAAENNGDNCIPRQELHGAVQVLLRQTEGVVQDAPCPFSGADITQAISRLKEQKLIVWDKVGDKNGVYLRDNVIAERTVTRYLMESMSSGKTLILSPAEVIQALAEYESDSGLVLDDEQRIAVCTAILEPVSILTGGPGTGKP